MKLHRLLNAALGLLLIGGCAATSTPYADGHFGAAVEAAKAQQTVNPDAARNPDPVAGVGAAAANSAVEEYHKSFQAPPPSFPVINIGGGGGAR